MSIFFFTSLSLYACLSPIAFQLLLITPRFNLSCWGLLNLFYVFFSFPFHFTSWFVYMINQMIKILIVMNLTVYINHITTKLHIYRCFVWPHNHYLYFSFSFMDFFSIIVNGSNCQNIKIKRKFILKHINILIKIACQILISS